MAPLRRHRLFGNLVELGLEVFKSLDATAQVAARAAEVVPAPRVVRELRRELMVHHRLVLAEVRQVLAGVAAGLGDEVAEVVHHFDAHRLRSVHVLAQDRFSNQGIQVLVAASELGEEGLMVDAGTLEIDIVNRHVNPLRQHLAGALHAVAQAHVGPAGAPIDGPAVHRHRIHVVEDHRVGGHIVQVPTEIHQHRNRPQGPKDAAGAQRVAHALFDPVLLRNLDVRPKRFQPAGLECCDHVVGAAHGIDARVGGRNGGAGAHAVGNRLHDRVGLLEPLGVDVHEPDLAALQRRCQQKVAAQATRKHKAAGADDGDGGHAGGCLLWESLGLDIAGLGVTTTPGLWPTRTECVRQDVPGDSGVGRTRSGYWPRLMMPYRHRGTVGHGVQTSGVITRT